MLISEKFLKKTLPEAYIIHENPAQWFEKYHTSDISAVVDSREVSPGNLFVALKGKKVDGHDFVDDAIAAGACAILIEKNKVTSCFAKPRSNILCIAVDDTLRALVTLAHAWRAQFSIPVIGVTGSMGKTTTKEMLRTIFDYAQMPAFVSHGNQNSLIGASLNLLQLTAQHALAVFEMGINETGEMKALVDLVQPTTALITTIAHAHGEGIGSLTQIAREKAVIFSQLLPHAVAVMTGDQPLLRRMVTHPKIVTFGFKRGVDLRADQVQASFTSAEQMHISCRLTYGVERIFLQLRSGHIGTLHNALAAIAMAHVVGVSLDRAVEALKGFKPVAQRFEGKSVAGNRGFIINDAHNANPETMQCAIKAFDAITTAAPKIAVIGQMFELGSRAHYWHAQVSSLLVQSTSLSKVILVGQMMREYEEKIAQTKPCIYVDTWEQAYELLLKELDSQPLVLLKSSKSVGLRHIPDRLVHEYNS